MNRRPIQEQRHLYARLTRRSDVLHLRVQPEGGFDGSTYRTRCGRHIELGYEATPLMVSEGARLCISCLNATG